MRKWLGALALCAGLTAQAQPLTGGLLGRPTADYAYIPAPTGCVAGLVPYFNSSLQLVCSSTVYAPTTDTLTSTGTIAARNLTATALTTPVITPPVSPVLSLLTTVTVVAGASLADGDYFTLSDGSAVVYEFDNDATVTPGRVGITFVGDETAQAIRDLVVVAINGSTLEATAIAAAADTLTVTSDTAGDSMGVNSENVADAGFLVPVWGEPTHATTYGYKVEACLADGTCAPSAEVQTTTGHATLSNKNYNSVTWGAVTGAATYRLTRVTGTPAGGEAPPRLLYTGTALNFHDTNATSVSDAVATSNETGVATAARFVAGQGSAASPAFAPYAGYGMYADQPNGKLWWSIAGTARMSLTAGPTLALNGSNPTISTVKLYYVGIANTTMFSSGGAGKFQHGDADAASPVMQTIQPQSVAAGTADTPGQPFNFDGSKGTGSGAGGPLVRSTAYPGASGTAQNTLSNRDYISSGWTTLTESSATAFATLTFGASTVAGADLLVTVHAADATNNQAVTYRVRVNSVRDATGNTQSTIGIIDDSATLPVAAGFGTLTSSFTVTEGASAVTINAIAVSSLTQTTLRASFQASANGAGLVVGPVGF